MPAPLSIIIPTRNAASSLPGAIAPLMEGLHDGLIHELIISDAGSEDQTVAIAQDLGARTAQGAPSRGGQLRRGADLAQADWLLFLHADTQLSAGWVAAAWHHIETASDHAGYFRLRFGTRGVKASAVAFWANLRSRLFGLPYGDQGLLISRALYDQIGGFADQPLMEDVDIARRLRGRLRALPVIARTSAERYETEGWMRRGGRNLWLLLRYLCGADPLVLAQAYRRSGRRS